jgi:MtN3 and saliva related transmembrane protein
MNWLALIASIFGLGMGFASFPQALKIFRRKSAKDVSPLTFLIFLVGGIVWLMYGLSIGNIPIVLAYSPGLLCSSLVLIGWLKYR